MITPSIRIFTLVFWAALASYFYFVYSRFTRKAKNVAEQTAYNSLTFFSVIYGIICALCFIISLMAPILPTFLSSEK